VVLVGPRWLRNNRTTRSPPKSPGRRWAAVAAIAHLIVFHTYFNVATCTITPLTDANIAAAVSDWISSPSAAATEYGGPITWWNVAAVSNM
jgi:hypothetical protein